MKKRCSPALMAVLVSGVVGCAQTHQKAGSTERDGQVGRAAFHPPEPVPGHSDMAGSLDPAPIPPDLSAPQPLDAYIRRALDENRTVQAAFHNARSLTHRIPQVTALDDPVVSNSIFPIPSVAPQYSLMGYNPYNMTLAQQYPWFGTRRLRGEVADRDVRIAVAELAVAQLDAVTAVRRSYFDLHAAENAKLAATAWNNRLVEVCRLRIASRTKVGRQFVYELVAPEVSYG